MTALVENRSGSLELLAFPLFGSEEAWSDFNETGHHIENGHAAPRLSATRAEAFFVEVADDAGVGKVLAQELHHEHESTVFRGVDFEPEAVIGDAQAEGYVFAVGAFTRRLGVWQFTPPLDGNHLPPGSGALLKDIEAVGAGNYVADTFEVWHWTSRRNFELTKSNFVTKYGR
jgi:hypothetical protein